MVALTIPFPTSFLALLGLCLTSLSFHALFTAFFPSQPKEQTSIRTFVKDTRRKDAKCTYSCPLMQPKPS